MKLINVEQGSPEWLSWRKTVITATDCPAILGTSPWATPYQCWQRKLDLIPEQEVNSAMKRGRLLEPIARAEFISVYGIDMQPAVVESTEYDFLGASLDGLSSCKKYILEIKCGQKSHAQAMDGIIPENYMDQVQLQLLVTKAEKAFYYSFDGSDGILIKVLPNPEFIHRFMPKAKEFWRCVAFFEAPPLQDADYKDMSDDPTFEVFANEYKHINEKLKRLEELKESYRQDLINYCDDKSCCGHGVKVLKTSVRGRVDYEAIPELKEVDLDKYRKKATVSWKILTSD